MTLSEKQQVFTQNVGLLIHWAYVSGYGLTFSDAYRDPKLAAYYASQGVGIANSLHSKRLAIDLNLFKGGVYQPNWEAHIPLGKFWKSLHELNRHGGDFVTRDANHYSMEHEGVK